MIKELIILASFFGVLYLLNKWKVFQKISETLNILNLDRKLKKNNNLRLKKFNKFRRDLARKNDEI